MTSHRIRIVALPAGPVSDLQWGRASTPVGTATIAWSPLGLHFLTAGPVEDGDARRWCAGPADHAGAREQSGRIFASDDAGTVQVSVSGTDFQLAVWTALCAIPAGRTISYGALAARIGCPGAARAVGSACGANPVAVLIPCHRVIAGDGSLGGYSGGLDVKRRLLELEGRSGLLAASC